VSNTRKIKANARARVMDDDYSQNQAAAFRGAAPSS
jgi:hypothetical protein